MNEATSTGDTLRQATAAMSRTTEAVAHTAGRMRDHLQDTDRRIRSFVQDYPLTSFFAAMAGGYLLARLANHRARG